MRYVVDKKITEVYTEIEVELYRRECCESKTTYVEAYNKFKSLSQNKDGIDITNTRKRAREIFKSLGAYDMLEGKLVNKKIGKVLPISVQILIKVLLLEIGSTRKKDGLYSKIKNKRFCEITDEDYKKFEKAIIDEYSRWLKSLEYPNGDENEKKECDDEFEILLQNHELEYIEEKYFNENEKNKYLYLKNKLSIYESRKLLLDEFLKRLEYLKKTEIYKNMVIKSIDDTLSESMINNISKMHKSFIQRSYTTEDGNIIIEVPESIILDSNKISLDYKDKYAVDYMHLSNSLGELLKYEKVSNIYENHINWMFELNRDYKIFVEIPRIALLLLTEVLYDKNITLKKEEFGDLLENVFIEERLNKITELTYAYKISMDEYIGDYREYKKNEIYTYIEYLLESHYIM